MSKVYEVHYKDWLPGGGGANISIVLTVKAVSMFLAECGAMCALQDSGYDCSGDLRFCDVRLVYDDGEDDGGAVHQEGGAR